MARPDRRVREVHRGSRAQRDDLHDLIVASETPADVHLRSSAAIDASHAGHTRHGQMIKKGGRLRSCSYAKGLVRGHIERVRRQGLEPRTRGLRGQSSPIRRTTTCDFARPQRCRTGTSGTERLELLDSDMDTRSTVDFDCSDLKIIYGPPGRPRSTFASGTARPTLPAGSGGHRNTSASASAAMPSRSVWVKSARPVPSVPAAGEGPPFRVKSHLCAPTAEHLSSSLRPC